MTETDKVLASLKQNMGKQYEYFVFLKNNTNIKNDIQKSLNSKKSIYIMQSSGLYKIYKGQLALYSTQLAAGPFPGLDDFTTNGMILSIPKVPHIYLQEFLDLCVEVNKESKAEIFAMLFYKDNKFEWVIPEQYISKASVDLTESGKQTISDYYNNGYLAVVEAHSHNTMDAFFSGTDNKDKTTNEPFDMVVGHIDKATPSILLRYKIDNVFVTIPVSTLFEEAPQKNVLPEYFRTWQDKIAKRPTPVTGYSYGYGQDYNWKNNWKTNRRYDSATNTWVEEEEDNTYEEDMADYYNKRYKGIKSNKVDKASEKDIDGMFDEYDNYFPETTHNYLGGI